MGTGNFGFGAATLAAFVVLASGAAAATSAALSRFAAPDAVVLAVEAPFAEPGSSVRLAVYDAPDTFLESALIKEQGVIGEDGVAVLTLRGLEPGDYAFVAYLDENGDMKLNKNAIGKPTEPYIFSNNVKPKLKKPSFAKTSVDVAPGSVVVLTLKS